MSHPVWVRGLKQTLNNQRRRRFQVAPRVGAWIETSDKANAGDYGASHPVWVRGLKHG